MMSSEVSKHQLGTPKRSMTTREPPHQLPPLITKVMRPKSSAISFGARLIQSTNLRVILQFRAYQVVSEPLNRCQRRLFSQFEVLEFCDNLVEGVVKVLKDVSKIQKKSKTTRAPVAKPSLFINKKPKVSQVFEEEPLDYPHQKPRLDTRRPLDDGLGPIFDEEDELGPTFDEKAPSMTSINIENHLCFDPSTTPKFQREANFKSSSQNSLNVFDDFVPVQERLAQRRPHKMPNRRCKEQFKTSKGEADPKRKHFQFDVQQFCDNFVKGVDKALKDVSKSQKKSTPTRAPVAEPSIFISEKPKVSQVFEEEPLDYPHQKPRLDTRRPLDDGLGPIFDEEDELGPTFDEKAPSMTSINIENHLCFDPSTTPTPLSKEHYKELCIISYVPDLFDKVRSNDIKRSSLDQLEKSFELDLQQLVFYSRKSFDSFVFKENSFSLRSYGHELITGILFPSSYDLDDFMVSTLLEQNSHKAETDFCGDSVLKPIHSYSESDLELKLLCSESDQVRHVLKMIYGTSCLENILIYNTFFDKHVEPWIRNSQFELNLLCSKSEKLAHVLNFFFSNCAITCPGTILVYNTYFDRLHNDLKRVRHVLGKETLVSNMNKHLPCTYDPVILMFVLNVQDKHDQSPRGLRNRSIDRAYKFKIWRWKYLRKTTSKLQGRRIKNDVPLGSAPGKTYMHGLIIESKRLEEESDQTEFICDSYAIYKSERLEEESDPTEFICDSYAIYKSGRIKWYQSHSEVHSSSQPAILNSSDFRRSTMSFGLLINHEEKAARKAQEEKLREWRYNKHTAELRAQYERRIKWYQSHSEVHSSSQPAILNSSDFRRSTMSFGLLINHEEKAARKAQEEKLREWSKEETPSTRTEEKTNKGLERWLGSFKVKIHQRITNPRPSPVLEEDQEAKDIEPDLSTVYVRVESMDDQMYQEEDLSPVFDEEKDLGPIFDEEENLGPIFDEEEELEAVSVLLAVQKVVEDVVDSGPEADHEKDLTTPYASGDILGSFSCDKLVQTFVWKEYDPVKLLRHEEGLQHFISEPGEETRDRSNNNQSLAKKIAKVEKKNVGSFILECPDLRTNPIKGGGDDATQIISYISTRSLRYEPAKQLIIAWLNGHFMGLIGLIHKVLDREKLMGLMQNVEALCSIRNQCLDLSKKGPPRNTSHDRIIYQSDGNSEIVNHAKGRNQSKSSTTKIFNIWSTVLVVGQINIPSQVFMVLRDL
ncbi:hypothetical protein DY000_02006934 [Brassica cretica]|uniref:Uncharacterized protein n=1 Tax=Brassica cretica TaxID=69181 RepID=A0ABQ7CEJ5_BRACR|nr:hypothetical protein DY000_02006934 [Brassica cretica]